MITAHNLIQDSLFRKSLLKGMIPAGLLCACFILASLFLNNPSQNVPETAPTIIVPVAADIRHIIEKEKVEDNQHLGTETPHAEIPDHHEPTTSHAAGHDKKDALDTHHAPPQHEAHASTDNHQETNDRSSHASHYKESLTEESPYGLLPRPDHNGLTPYEAYKHPYDLDKAVERKKAVIVIGPVGMSMAVIKAIAEKTPPAVSILLSPYTENIDMAMTILRESGHEVWLELPVEQNTLKNTDTGPLSLRADFSTAKNKTIFNKILATAQGYAGLFITNADHTTITFNSPRIKSILNDIFLRGLGLAYQSTIRIPGIDNLSPPHNNRLHHIKALHGEPFTMTKEHVLKDIDTTTPNLTIMLSPYPNDINNFDAILQALKQEGYILAPLSAGI